MKMTSDSKTTEKKPKGNRHREESIRARISNVIMCGPITIWTVVFIIIPVILLVFMSFMTKGPLGRIEYKFTLSNYTDIFKPVYFNVVKQSLIIAFWTTLLTVLIGYPLGMVMSKMKKKTSGMVTIALMLPLWVSGLVILYSQCHLVKNATKHLNCKTIE